MNVGLNVVLPVGEHEFLALIDCRVYSAAPEKGHYIEDIDVLYVNNFRERGLCEWVLCTELTGNAMASLLSDAIRNSPNLQQRIIDAAIQERKGVA